MFYHGQFPQVDEADEEGHLKLVLKDVVTKFSYIKRERGIFPLTVETPLSFVVTMYHVVFMYSDNITVVSKMNQEVIHNVSYDKKRPFRGIDLDYHRHQLLAYTFHDRIMLTSLENEDVDAWKHHL